MNYKCTPEVCWAGRNRSLADHFVHVRRGLKDFTINHSRNAVNTEENKENRLVIYPTVWFTV